ncbi:MAG: CotH kinase family protein, partial [Fimbriimonadaceae bacterium]|nr:CotH kinase family protein [Chitinophagales bacterium]
TLEYKGTNASSYNTYELQTNEDESNYSDLIQLTDVLNNTPIEDLQCELEKIFNVNNFLKIYAIDIATGHWDNYGANQNNYYLYHNQFTGQFEFLSYDCDNVLGIDWLGIDWTERNIYNWNFDDRPLVERLFQIDEYKDRFSYYMDQLINTVLLPENINPHIDSIKELITPAAIADEYKGYDWGYTNDDFLNGFDTDDIDGHTPYGIKNFIEQRNDNTISQIELNDIDPIIQSLQQIPPLPQLSDTVLFLLHLEDDGEIYQAQVDIYFDYDGGPPDIFYFNDEGLLGDEIADDNIYTFLLPSSFYTYTSPMLYWIVFSDDSGNTTVYPNCYLTNPVYLTIGYTPPGIVINELIAKNDSIITDAGGEYEDYIELYNKSDSTIYLGDKYLSDDFSNPSKWKLPEINLQPDNYILLWADNDTDQGDDHCDFKLSSSGEELGLFAGVSDYFSVIDTITFGGQSANISLGRLPNGTGNFTFLPVPSPGMNNGHVLPEDTVINFAFYILGNPYTNTSSLLLQLTKLSEIKIDIYSISGQHMESVENKILDTGNYFYTVNTMKFGKGIYFVRLETNGEISAYKFVVL